MIQLDAVTIRAGKFCLASINLMIPTGHYAVLMGRTGRGKTTILEAIGGLRSVESGRIWIDGIDVTDWLPGDRQIGYVPQDLALFPTMTVHQHLEFALRLRREPRDMIRQRTAELADLLGITPLLTRPIRGLSGGERQRVALGRALSFRPTVLLLDEPLSALDETTRAEMHDLLSRVQKETQVTTLHVTHNQEEATALADLVLRLDEGEVRVA